MVRMIMMICKDVNERSVDGDDLERLGYTQYRGGNRENVYKVILKISISIYKRMS